MITKLISENFIRDLLIPTPFAIIGKSRQEYIDEMWKQVKWHRKLPWRKKAHAEFWGRQYDLCLEKYSRRTSE